MATIVWLLLGALLGIGGAHTHRKVRNLGGWSAARALGRDSPAGDTSRCSSRTMIFKTALLERGALGNRCPIV
jgi:hypothetical protein